MDFSAPQKNTWVFSNGLNFFNNLQESLENTNFHIMGRLLEVHPIVLGRFGVLPGCYLNYPIENPLCHPFILLGL